MAGNAAARFGHFQMRFVWINVGLAWISIWRKSVLPKLTKRCGVFAGMTTMPPPCTSRFSSPTVMVAVPSIVNATSTYGCLCSGGPCPGLALTMKAEKGAPSFSPTNSCDMPTNGSCSRLRKLIHQHRRHLAVDPEVRGQRPEGRFAALAAIGRGGERHLHAGDSHSAFTDSSGTTFDRTGANITCRENVGKAGLEGGWLTLVFFPSR